MVNAISTISRPSVQASNKKLKEVAAEFEGLFIEMLLKQMRSANSALSGETKSFARSTYEGWQDEEMARSISRQGSFGLAEILYRQLQTQAAATGDS